MEAARGQKQPSDAKNRGHAGVNVLKKKFLMKVAQQPQKPHNGPIRFELQLQGRGHRGLSCAKRSKRLRTCKAGVSSTKET